MADEPGLPSKQSVFLYAARALAFRRVAASSSDSFTSTSSSSYGGVVLALALLIVVELPVVHALLGAFVHSGEVFLHALSGAVHAWMFFWVIGDYRAMRESAHRFEGNSFVIDLGLRARAVVPLRLIERVAVEEASETPAKGEARVTPLETPNVVVVLSEPVAVHYYFGIVRSSGTLRLYVDDPAALVAAARSRLSPDSGPFGIPSQV